jgi:hypothetical protein
LPGIVVTTVPVSFSSSNHFPQNSKTTIPRNQNSDFFCIKSAKKHIDGIKRLNIFKYGKIIVFLQE